MKNFRKDIGLKAIFIVALSTAIFLAASVSLSYFYLFDSSRNNTMESRKNMADLMAGSIADAIDNQTELVKISASAGALKEAVEASNEKYAGMDAVAARQYILDIDSKWIKSAGDHPFIGEYLGNKASLLLKAGITQKPGVFNILALDKYGALVGASYRPRGFYYGDEDWFKEVVSAKKTGMSFGEAVFDEPSGRWSFPVASAIENDNGEIIGAYNALIDVSVFFKTLESFGAGKSGKAALIDSRGYLIFYPGVKPFSNKFCEYNELKKLLSDSKGYSVISTAYMGNGKMSVAVSLVTSPMLSENGMKLYVVVSESSRLLFYPLNNLAVKMVIFSLILTLMVLILAWMIFKGIFTQPIKKLIDGMRNLGDGRLDYRVDIKTGDEMEDLGRALNNAAESLSHITTSIKVLDKEKSECKITQEKFEKENIGFLFLMSEIRGLLLDIDKGVEGARQDAIKSQNEKQKTGLELLHSRSASLIKALEKEIYAAKLEAGNAEFKMEQSDFRDIIKESIFAFEPKIRDKGLDLRLDVPKLALPMRVDKDKIRQALDILLENSLTTTEKGYIAISVIQTKEWVECSISDTGIAIPKESISEIFDRFAGFSRIPQQKGSWIDLGSYILRKVVEKHGGKVYVESGTDKVTKFTLKLPRIATP